MDQAENLRKIMQQKEEQAKEAAVHIPSHGKSCC